MKSVLAFVAVLPLSAPASAESRSVLVVVTHDKDGKATAAVYSDEQRERRAAGPVEEACKAISGVPGKGSIVSVHVVTDQPMGKRDRKALFATIDDSVRLELAYYGPETPKHLAERFLKPPPTPGPGKGDNRGVKPDLVVDRADPPQRDGKAHHVVFAGSGHGPVRSTSSWSACPTERGSRSRWPTTVPTWSRNRGGRSEPDRRSPIEASTATTINSGVWPSA